jgi:N-acetylglutamate synthase-like GNAT family acetyltransferase
MISLRAATAADQDTIVRLTREAHNNLLSLKWPNFVLAVDEATGAVVGTGQVKRHGDGSYELASIATVPAYQHRGIAHQIIAELLRRHPGVLYLTCIDYMAPLYQEFGFRTIGPEEMTPYFRRIARLAQVLLHFSSSGKLRIMKRDPAASGSAPATSSNAEAR